VPYPTVIELEEPRGLGAGKFTMNGREYIYVTKTKKHDASPTHLETWYSF